MFIETVSSPVNFVTLPSAVGIDGVPTSRSILSSSTISLRHPSASVCAHAPRHRAEF